MGHPKGFRAFVFGLRSNTVPNAPVGWKLEDEESVPHMAELAANKLSMMIFCSRKKTCRLSFNLPSVQLSRLPSCCLRPFQFPFRLATAAFMAAN